MRDLIGLRFAKRLGLSTVQLYLQRRGMPPQKPLARAKERSPAAGIKAWLETSYPMIAHGAKALRAVAYSGQRPASPTRTRSGGYMRRRPDPGRYENRQGDMDEHDVGGPAIAA